MSKCKKRIISSMLALALCAPAMAGQGGAFVGIGGIFGFAGDNKLSDHNGSFNNYEKFNSLGGGGEVLAGYKFFFTDWIGLRGGLNVDYQAVFFENLGGVTSVTDGMALLLNASLMLDLLLAIPSSGSFSFGGFVGVYGGFDYWHGPLMNQLNDEQINQGFKPISFFGSFGMNLGLILGFGKSHSIEVAGKIPFIDNKIFNLDGQHWLPGAGGGGGVGGANLSNNLAFKRPYTIGIRYVYSFVSGGE